MDTAPIVVTQLTKRFGDVTAVEDLTFTVRAGDVCGLLGPNGAGKTTTLRMLLGLVHPDAGTSSILATPVAPGAPVLSRVGAIIERPGAMPHLTGIANLRAYWRIGGGTWPPGHLERALAIAGLGDAIDRKVKTYSQGMRQRLGIAQALMGAPDVLVLDEPTNGLDPQEMRDIRSLLQRIGDDGTTVLLSSHLLGEVEQACSHVVVMNHGRLVTAGAVAELLTASRSVYVEVDDNDAARRILEETAGTESIEEDPPGLVVSLDGARRSDLVAALVAGGVRVETVTARNRLEDVFLNLVGDDR